MDQRDQPPAMVLRIFPDYADTVIWNDFGPVPYEDINLSAQLQHELEAWERFYYEKATPYFEWAVASDRERFTEDGRRLTESIAKEVGSEFEFELRLSDRGPKNMVRSDSAPTNPEAARAFHELVREKREWEDRMGRIEQETKAGH